MKFRNQYAFESIVKTLAAPNAATQGNNAHQQTGEAAAHAEENASASGDAC